MNDGIKSNLYKLPKELLIKIILDREKLFSVSEKENIKLYLKLGKKYRFDPSICEECWNFTDVYTCNKCDTWICASCINHDTGSCTKC